VDSKHSESSHNRHIQENKLQDISSIFNNLSIKKEEREKDAPSKASLQSQLDELKNLDIWYSKKKDDDVYGRERADGTLPPYY